MTVEEKLRLLDQDHYDNYDDSSLQHGHDTLPGHDTQFGPDTSEDAGEVQRSKDLMQARAFLLQDNEDMKWLIENITRGSSMQPTGFTMLDTRHAILERLISARCQGGKTRITLSIGWDPISFVDRQFNNEDVRLQQVICLCGNGTSVEAASVADYSCRLWPTASKDVLPIVADAVKQKAGLFSGKQIPHRYVQDVELIGP
jgi:hypothetical protein